MKLTLLVIGSSKSNKSIFLRSIDDPQRSIQYTEHKAETTVACFSPSGSYVASGDIDGTVRVWDCAGSGLTKGEYFIIGGPINDLAWDGDSQRLIAVGDGRQQFGRCITADSGNSIGTISGHSRGINSVSVKQQRPIRAAAAGDDKTLVFYHGPPFKYNNGYRDNHSNYIYGVSFSPDGRTLVSVGGDRRIWLYDGQTGEPKKEIGCNIHAGSIFSVSFSPDSRKFATASADRTVKVWDVEYGKSVESWTMGDSVPDQQVGVVWPSGRNDGLIISLSLSGDLNYLYEGNDKATQVVQGHQRSINTLCSSFGGHPTLWSGSYEGRVNQWDLCTGKAKRVGGIPHSTYVAGLTTMKNGDGLVYSAGWDDMLRSINTNSNTYTENAFKLSGQPKDVSSDKGTVLVATADGIEIFSQSKKMGTFDCKCTPSSVSVVKDISAIGFEDSSILICSVYYDRLTPRFDLKLARHPVTALSFTEDGGLLAAGDSSGRIKVYNTKDGSLVTDRWTSHTARITCLAWDSQGHQLVSGGLDTNIFVWNLSKPGDWLQVSNAHKEGINGIAWTSKNMVSSVGSDATVKFWKIESMG